MAEESGKYGAFAFLPVAVGFTLGVAFVYGADILMPALGAGEGPHLAFGFSQDHKPAKEKEDPASLQTDDKELTIRIDKIENGDLYQRRKGPLTSPVEDQGLSHNSRDLPETAGRSWRRTVLLILASRFTTSQGLAVGVGFGVAGKTLSATFESTRYGQLSGMVDPVAGVLGAFAVVVAEPLHLYALAFAAGAMVYVVMDNIIPEAQVSGNRKLASWTSIQGFVVMMSLDVGLG